jgi:hypothetical protein
MSNQALDALAIAVVLTQLTVLLWVLIRRRGMRPVLAVNILFALGMLIGASQLIREEPFLGLSLCVAELVVLTGSAFGFRGWLSAKIIAWIGFAVHFTLSLAVMLFVLTFEFKCCGYL